MNRNVATSRSIAFLLCLAAAFAFSPAPLGAEPFPGSAAAGSPAIPVTEAASVSAAATSLDLVAPTKLPEQDRIYLVSTRHLSHDVCCAPLNQISFRMWQLDCGCSRRIDLADYQSSLSNQRPVIIYVHGNRMPSEDLVERAMIVRRTIRSRCQLGPVDWVIFSWPSSKEPGIIRDFREKADRCDAQGLYLASFLRRHAEASIPLAMIGYSFGARVTTGALHALAGGTLHGRRLPDPPITGAAVSVGLVAPALESKWLSGSGYHRRATQNMDRLVLLYNRRDAVLKRYWLIEKVRRETALGYSGPTSFARRHDGTSLPVRARDCAPSVKLRHSELDYYKSGCNAGCDMARLINGIRIPAL